MKPTQSLYILFLVLCITSCKNDEFSCDRNSTIVLNGDKECAHTIVQRHVVASDLDPTDYETFDFNLKYNGNSLLIGVTLYDRIVEEGETYSDPDTYYGGAGVSGDVAITITNLNRDKRTISLDFDFTGAYFDHETSTSHDLKTTGTMTDINY